MSYIKCPNCRVRIWVGDSSVYITPRQRDILQAIPEVARNSQAGVATTSAIASRVNWSVRTVRYELTHLEHMGEVQRCRYQSGWLLAERPVMMVA